MSNPLQQVKFVRLVDPAAILKDASATAVVVDTAGWDYATMVLHEGVTDVDLTALNVSESDDNSNWSVIAAANFAVASSLDMDGNALALPAGTDDNKLHVVHLDMRKRKRYLKLVATANNGTNGAYMSAVGILSRGEAKPNTSAKQGAKAVVIV